MMEFHPYIYEVYSKLGVVVTLVLPVFGVPTRRVLPSARRFEQINKNDKVHNFCELEFNCNFLIIIKSFIIVYMRLSGILCS
jgi:hypothetical protein